MTESLERFNRFSCERCWSDAGYCDSEKSHAYQRFVDSRDCTPEQQAGRDAEFCDVCQRWTIHQIVGACLTCPVYCYPMQPADRKPATEGLCRDD